MNVGSIPVTAIWEYIDRFGLPEWWEPVLLQVDAALVASINEEMAGDARVSKANKAG